MRIGIDMMGGDFAPLEAVKGVALFLSESDHTVDLYLFGDEALLIPLLESHGVVPAKYQIVHASEVIGMHEHPTKAFKEKQGSSIALGFHFLSTGKVDAFISAGNTGAMLVGAMFSIKAINGVSRPTISTIVPKENGETGLLLDVGINADCKPDHLNQFALLGSIYAKNILGIADPRVGLINLGEEEGKGNLLAQATYPLLKENKQIHFVGNIEGRDILSDKADVLICDGFTGNVLLKLLESMYEITQRKQIHHEFFSRFDFETHGGTPVLGVARPVIIGHGISREKSFSKMISLAIRMIETSVLEKMTEAFHGR